MINQQINQKQITFKEKKKNHFYSQKNEKGQLELVSDPVVGEKYYEFACVSGGSGKRPLILELPISLCAQHIKSHNNTSFFVNTCREWIYRAIPTPLGSTPCRECRNELFVPMPFLCSANLSGANLTSADLRGADLTSANLTSANLTSADLTSANLTSANLTSANLRGANLTSANLTSANLRGANLCGADLCGANLCGADLCGAKTLEYAYWDKWTIINDEYKKLLSKKMFLE
jgi:hypothetical protein